MNRYHVIPLASVLLLGQAQTPAPPDPAAASESVPQSNIRPQGETAPALRTYTLVHGSVKAIDYRLLKSSTRIRFQGTSLAPAAGGSAKLKAKEGSIVIKAKFTGLPDPGAFGPPCLTYVLWAVSPEGQVANLGELQVSRGKARFKTQEQLPAFALLVTAEPYYAVARPSDAVVLENTLEQDTRGHVDLVDARLDLMPQQEYQRDLTASATPPPDTHAPAALVQARQAVRIALGAGAGTYARNTLEQAQVYLRQAESAEGGEKAAIMTARSAIASAEQARFLAVQGLQAQARAQARAQEQKLAQARLEQIQLEAARAQAAREEAQRQTQAAARENQDLRARLVAELNGIMQTKATAQGLIVSMSGVLFRTGRATLLPAAREKLAKVAGILASHKGLRIQAEGFTDSTGSAEFNEKLSRERAEAAKDFLVSQGVPPEAISSVGYGPGHPVADNATEAGRQVNRRVELVLSGEGITPPQALSGSAPAPEGARP